MITADNRLIEFFIKADNIWLFAKNSYMETLATTHGKSKKRVLRNDHMPRLQRFGLFIFIIIILTTQGSKFTYYAILIHLLTGRNALKHLKHRGF
jgi:hypothetical protein